MIPDEQTAPRSIRRIVTVVGVLLLASHALGQVTVTSPPPVQVAFVPHLYAWQLTKHPTLPVLYLGCNNAPEGKNLVTFGLDGAGNVLTNTMRTFDDFFTNDGKNETNFYSVLRPIVLPEQPILCLAAAPVNPALYTLNSNAQHIATVGLDDHGQPTKLIRALRTTHTEQSIVRMEYDPVVRRLCLGYFSYWGWVSVDKDGVPSREFHFVPTPYNFWDFTVVPQWQRIIGMHQDAYLCDLRLTSDGNNADFVQATLGPTQKFGSFEVSPAFHKVYILISPELRAFNVYQLNKSGGFTGVPRRFPIGETHFLRLDAKQRRLYSFHPTGVIRIQPLDAEGWPTGSLEVFQARCGTIRDAFVDEATGKVYVACTQPPG